MRLGFPTAATPYPMAGGAEPTRRASLRLQAPSKKSPARPTKSSTTAPFLLPSIPAASSKCGGGGDALSAAMGQSRMRCGGGPRCGHATVAAGSKDDGSSTVEGEKREDDAPAFNPFGFVTDNPFSRSAIQLPAVPAEDGNAGQILY